jgi:D-inositol-3-phosphate glycosyltransferase
MKQLRGLWVSDLVAPTGFGRVSHSILKYLPKSEFDITGLGVNYKGDPHPYQFAIFPAILGGDVYGLGRINTILQALQFDFIFILNDTWVINKYLEEIKKMPKEWKRPYIVVYFPVDSEEHDKDWYANFDIVDRVVTYTKFGHDVVKKLFPEMEVSIIPHGIDTTVFYKAFPNRRQAKEALFGSSRQDLLESFIFLNANRNQPRKRLDITIRGFSEFLKLHPNDNVKLYLHCGVRDSSIEVPKIASRYGVDKNLIVTNLNQGIQTVPDDRLNLIYNACDVGINTSMGEGWGLTSIEHAITGAPQVVPDHSACGEIFGDCGVLVSPVCDYTFDHTATVGKLVSPEGVAHALDKLYVDKEYYNTISNLATRKFGSAEYQWENVAKQWKDLFLGLMK